MKKIAFQGRRGAYSESAAYHLFGNNIEVIPMDTFEQIFQGIETGAIDGGAIPIENSTAGSIYDNYDLLFKWRTRLSPKSSCRLNTRSAHCRAQSSKTSAKC